MSKDINYSIIIMALMILVAVIAVGLCYQKLGAIERAIEKQFNYQADLDMCYEGAQEYMTYCHLERDDDGTYNWYYNPSEGGI